MGRLQLHFLYTFLQGIKKITVGDLGIERIEEIGLTVQNFDKLALTYGGYTMSLRPLRSCVKMNSCGGIARELRQL